MQNRCSGHCCKKFVFPLSPDEIEYWKNVDEEKYRNFDVISEMLIYRKTVNGEHIYDCKHLADNGDCKIYKYRPNMCRNYPADVCEFKGCTYNNLL